MDREPGGLWFIGSQRVGHDWVTHTIYMQNPSFLGKNWFLIKAILRELFSQIVGFYYEQSDGLRAGCKVRCPPEHKQVSPRHDLVDRPLNDAEDWLGITTLWHWLTLSFRPKTLTLPWACSFRNLHSTKFWPFSPGRVMFLLATVGLAVPARTWGSVW